MADKQLSSGNKISTVHYVIAVHGIGEQRKNETVLPVIKQFAAARHHTPDQTDFLTLGRLTAQSKENLWIEYQGIPNHPDKSLEAKPWFPRVAVEGNGKNIRFVDFCWSEVTHEQHKKVGEATARWSQSLINRLDLRISLGGESTRWIADLMRTLREGVLFTEKIMDLKLPKLSNVIFAEFLGDVELYGDFPFTRGRAVRLFHETMARLDQAHYDEFGGEVKPHYTIIAHSLGTVLTMDAIAYAYANKKSRSSKSVDAANNSTVHFPGYDCSLLPGEDVHPVFKQDEMPRKLPSADWVTNLHSYVTLGSPIDKYLAMWTENYPHFANTEWMDEALIAERKSKIRHFNYADEQDPVGHELNILKTTPVWQKLMESGEDVVFTRYSLPGVAHVGYWDDYDLFYRILDLSIDNREQSLAENEKPQGHYAEWFKMKVYRKALLISYVVIPFIGWLIATIALDSVAQALLIGTVTADLMSCCASPEALLAFGISIDFPWMAMLIFLVTLYFTHILMKLVIQWRLAMVVARTENSPMEEKTQRKKARAFIRNLILWAPVVWGVLFVGLLFPNIIAVLPDFFAALLPTIRIGLLLAFVVSLDILMVYARSRKKWKNLKQDIVDTTFDDYLSPLRK